jgi:hypothetical protein
VDPIQPEWLAVLRDRFRRPEEPLPREEFQRLALAVFRHQFYGNAIYGAYCRGQGRVPDTVTEWRDIPPVPASAFKRLHLYSGLPSSGEGGGEAKSTPPETVFETSGTRGGPERRGRHPVASLQLYRESSTAWFGAHLVPEDEALPILALVPSPEAAPSSSLSRMMGFAMERWGAPDSRFLAHPERGVDHGAVREALRRVEGGDRPVLLMGTAFAWVHWLERAGAEGWRFRLPEGSRLMETGGFKGRARAVSRAELYASLAQGLGVSQGRMVNEYGMTELLSQLYEPVLATRGHALEDPNPPRWHRAPPWLGLQVLHPETLEPLPQGEAGLLAFLDLANVGSVAAVLTEDVGWLDGQGGLHLQGRVAGAEPRGCSLALEAVLEAGE